MFENALQNNPDSEQLLLEYLKCCQQVWSSARLLSEWDKVLAQHPKNLNLWQQYIGYRLTELSAFSVSSILDIFTHCFQTIGAATPQGETDSLRVVDRLCRFLRDAGFSEQAMGIYQALIEWNFYRPVGLDEHADRLASFQRFWEKEFPRFGEDGACGWSAYDDLDTVPYHMPAARFRARESQLAKKIEREQDLDVAEHLPTNSSLIKDTYHEDPYRIVLFDDVAPFLIDLTAEATKQELIGNFIRFAILPNYGLGATSVSTLDPFSHSDLGFPSSLARFFPKRSAFEGYDESIGIVHGMYVAAEPPAAQDQDDAFGVPLRHFPHNGADLFLPSFVVGGLNPRFSSSSYFQFAW